MSSFLQANEFLGTEFEECIHYIVHHSLFGFSKSFSFNLYLRCVLVKNFNV